MVINVKKILVCHIPSHSGGLLKEEKEGNRLGLSLVAHFYTTGQNVSILKCSTARKRSQLFECFMYFAQNYPKSHNTPVCQPSRKAKQTLNNEQTTGDTKEREREKKRTPKRGKKKVCERAKER